MATNQTGVSIVIKAWLPVSGSISEQIASLQMVETAHSTGDYAELLKAAKVEDIKTEQKTRRIEEPTSVRLDAETARHLECVDDETGEIVQQSIASREDASGLKEAFDKVEPAGTIGGAEIVGDDEPAPAKRKRA